MSRLSRYPGHFQSNYVFERELILRKHKFGYFGMIS
jgi:hypothetical protein